MDPDPDPDFRPIRTQEKSSIRIRRKKTRIRNTANKFSESLKKE